MANEPRRASRLHPRRHRSRCRRIPLHEYRIDSVLGQGGFGIAYAATDVNLAAKVVIKEYLPEEFAFRALGDTVQARDDMDQEFYQNGLDSFLVEARTLATFRHRHIVRVARFFEANKTAYMALEYERGQSLKSYRKKRGDHIDEKTMVALLAPLLDGLEVVHNSGYPATSSPTTSTCATRTATSCCSTSAPRARPRSKSEIGMVATPGYGPTEQYAGGGRQGPWTDISMGATLSAHHRRKPLDAPARLGDRSCPAESLGKDHYSSHSCARSTGHSSASGGPTAGCRAVPLGALRPHAGGAGAAGGIEAKRRGRIQHRGRVELGDIDALPALRCSCIPEPRGCAPASWPIAVKMTRWWRRSRR